MIDVLRIQIKDDCIEMCPPLAGTIREAVKEAGVTGITDIVERVTTDGSPIETFGFTDKSSEIVRSGAERIETAVSGLGRSALILDVRAEVEGPRVIEAPRARRHGGMIFRKVVKV